MDKKMYIIIGFLTLLAVGIVIALMWYADGKTREVSEATARRIAQYQGAILRTNYGDIEIRFFPNEAPVAVVSFTELASRGFYTGTKFHRVIEGFMIQGGDPLSKDDARKDEWGTGGPGYAFADEIGERKITRGVVAMANSGPNTNGSQFFIVTADETPWLDGKHTVFGEVVSGMDVADEISRLPVDERDRPLSPVVIEEIVLK